MLGLRKLAVLQRADILAHSEYGQNRLERLDALESIAADLVREGAVFSIKDLAVKGSDLIDEGVPEGPEIGKVLTEVFDAYMRGEVGNDAGELRTYVREHILTVR